MKSQALFKKTFNNMLDQLSGHKSRSTLPSEAQLADSFKVSRTTVRKALVELDRRKVVSRQGKHTLILRKPTRADYFPLVDTVATSDHVEKKFLDWMLRSDHKPDQPINALELAREFGVSTGAIREYLNRFGRFGLVEKSPHSGWVLRGFTVEFALELFEVRELFEIRSAKTFAKQLPDAPGWAALRQIEDEHRKLLANIKTRYHDFSALDERFHRLLNDSSRNRFIADFHDVISLIFHYHYQWNKVDEKERNLAAIHEHLDYINALFTRNPDRIETACRRHLKSARKTLLASIA
jgi:DNA-binding GntR family transcriptional regulator